MDDFTYKNGRLFCEDVDVADIAAAAGTAVYVYSSATLLRHYRAIADAFRPLSPLICYSIKSLANVHVLKLLCGAGSGFDVTSGGELARALAAGGEGAKIVYAGVGKTDDEIRQAFAAGIAVFNVESEAEFENISRLAAAAGVTVHAALRVNPDVYDPQTHTYTATGRKETKFGVDIERAVGFFQTYGRDPHVLLDGIHLHIGSPIYSPAPYVRAIEKTMQLIARLEALAFHVGLMDIGGGFAADYEEGQSPSAADYARNIVPLLAGKGLKIVLEPGRQISCNAGVLLARVLYVKKGGDRNFVIVDAAMTDLMRPALYGAKHFVYPACADARGSAAPAPVGFRSPGGVKVDVVGGVCESTDVLAAGRVLPPLARGDLLAVFSAGAYGFVMSSQYNSRPRCAEVLVDRSAWRIIRRRESYQDLFAAEI